MRMRCRWLLRIVVMVMSIFAVVASAGAQSVAVPATPAASPAASPLAGPGLAASFDGDPTGSSTLPGPLPEGQIGVQWTIRGEGDVGSPVAAGNLVLLRTAGTLTAYDVASGENAWEFTKPGPVSDPFVWGGRVYLADSGMLFALDVASGEQVWQSNLAFGLDASRQLETAPVPPVVTDGVVYVLSGPLAYAIDADNGDYIWRADLENRAGVSSPVITAATMLFITTSPEGESGLLALSRDAGQPVLQFTSRMHYTGFATVDDLVVAWGGGSIDTFFDYSGVITSSTMCRMAGTPVIQGGTLFGVCDQGVLALDLASGSAQLLMPDVAGTPIGIAGTTMLMRGGTVDRSISAVDLDTSTVVWETSLPPTIEGDLLDSGTATNGRVLVLTQMATESKAESGGFTLVALGGTEGRFGKPLPLAANPPAAGSFIRLTTDTSMLAAPSPEGAPIAELMTGDQVLITGQIEEVEGQTWWQIDDPRSGQTGWVTPEVFETEGGQ